MGLVTSLVGGVLIGLSASLLLFFNGRIAGISGILYACLGRPSKENLWRYFFIAGLVLGGLFMFFQHPNLFQNNSDRSIATISIAGFLVGLGTFLAGGCTSGHGVCGVSRLSPRSLVATITFMTLGFISVALYQLLARG